MPEAINRSRPDNPRCYSRRHGIPKKAHETKSYLSLCRSHAQSNAAFRDGRPFFLEIFSAMWKLAQVAVSDRRPKKKREMEKDIEQYVCCWAFYRRLSENCIKNNIWSQNIPHNSRRQRLHKILIPFQQDIAINRSWGTSHLRYWFGDRM
jgi:hypothetical protein